MVSVIEGSLTDGSNFDYHIYIYSPPPLIPDVIYNHRFRIIIMCCPCNEWKMCGPWCLLFSPNTCFWQFSRILIRCLSHDFPRCFQATHVFWYPRVANMHILILYLTLLAIILSCCLWCSLFFLRHLYNKLETFHYTKGIALTKYTSCCCLPYFMLNVQELDIVLLSTPGFWCIYV